MLELNAENAVGYLARCGLPLSNPRVTQLGGGVSNTVLLIEQLSPCSATADPLVDNPSIADRVGDSLQEQAAPTPPTRLPDRFILKQSLGRLRVAEEWLSDRNRIFRECDAIRKTSAILPVGAAPRVLFEDDSNFAFAMTAAPPGAKTWKDLLFEDLSVDGLSASAPAQDFASYSVHADTAALTGQILGSLVRMTWQSPKWSRDFSDQAVFEQLRVDPYYRAAAARNPSVAPQIFELIAESSERRVSLVHGDWSPKNLLVCPGPDGPGLDPPKIRTAPAATAASVMAIDFEVVHFGDPAFDTAFLLNHLLLKSIVLANHRQLIAALARIFWRAYLAALSAGSDWIESATLRHLGCLLLARVDGKSPAEYLRDDHTRTAARRLAHSLILEPPASIAAAFARVDPVEKLPAAPRPIRRNRPT